VLYSIKLKGLPSSFFISYLSSCHSRCRLSPILEGDALSSDWLEDIFSKKYFMISKTSGAFLIVSNYLSFKNIPKLEKNLCFFHPVKFLPTICASKFYINCENWRKKNKTFESRIAVYLALLRKFSET
jgi:hypothetical protein